MGRSILRISARADWSRSGIVTRPSPAAARKAAFRATLWMLPPLRFSRARAS